MKRAIFSLAALAALTLAACGGGDDAASAELSTDAGQEAAGQTQAPSSGDPAAAPAPVPPAEGVSADLPAGDEENPPPTGGYGGGERQKYRDCMRQASATQLPIREQIEGACKRLPDAPK